MRTARPVTALVATALVAASTALAAQAGSKAQPASLTAAATRTDGVGALRFQLVAQVQKLGAPPLVLHASGASSASAAYVHLKVGDIRTPGGAVLTGPAADEETDGTFLYFRSTLTRGSVGDRWVREPLARVAPTSPELRLLRQLSPTALLRLVGRAQQVTGGAGGRVFHAVLAYTDPVVQTALAPVAGGIEYRDLRLTTWVEPQDYVRLLVLTGRTADGSTTLVLTLALDRYGRPVTVTPPPQGSFVDFDLSRLSM